MDLRELKALELAARAKIVWKDGVWLVPSQSTTGTYKVVCWPGAESCGCEDFQLRQAHCKHILAAKLVEERDGRQKAPGIDTDTLPVKKTYKQNWPLYNLAQSVEKDRLQALLAELCAGVPEPPMPKTGRRPHAIADRLFACAFKVYCGVSSRRTGSDMSEAVERGYLSRVLHCTKVNHFFNDDELTAPLRDLVQRSAVPLAAIETDFAVDSSGFSTSKFVRWFDEKYGIERSGNDWVKVHICTGVKTNVVTAVEIRGRDAHDSPLLPALVRTTVENFRIGEVSADKGYLSAENVEAIAALGGVPFIAPKVNTTGGKGGLFEKMYHFYAYRRDEFLRHYHKRSNVESTFSAIKRKFGDAVRSKTTAAMTNEVLCKLLCQNLCCLIRSQIELGIETNFWPAKDDAPRDVLRLTAADRC